MNINIPESGRETIGQPVPGGRRRISAGSGRTVSGAENRFGGSVLHLIGAALAGLQGGILARRGKCLVPPLGDPFHFHVDVVVGQSLAPVLAGGPGW